MSLKKQNKNLRSRLPATLSPVGRWVWDVKCDDHVWVYMVQRLFSLWYDIKSQSRKKKRQIVSFGKSSLGLEVYKRAVNWICLCFLFVCLEILGMLDLIFSVIIANVSDLHHRVLFFILDVCLLSPAVCLYQLWFIWFYLFYTFFQPCFLKKGIKIYTHQLHR